MRLIVFFDLPVDTAFQRKQYRLFRKFLIHDGYLMVQESVYSKLAMNNQLAETAIKRLQRHRPPAGVVQVLKITEKQYATMVYITGSPQEQLELSTTEELVVL